MRQKYLDQIWNINPADFYKQKTIEEKIKFLLRYAILAPSTHNSQPWLFKIENNTCKIFFDPALQLKEADPLGRCLYISMGCCIENLLIAAKYFGIFQDIKYHFQKNLVAEIVFNDSNVTIHNEHTQLLNAIIKRRNVRGNFEKIKINDKLLSKLSQINDDNNIVVNIISEEQRIKKLAECTVIALKKAYSKVGFRKEMSHWIRNAWTNKKDGIPGYSLPISTVLSFFLPKIIRYKNIGRKLSKLNYENFISAPAVCVVTVLRDMPKAWLDAGQIIERLLLTSVNFGLSTSIFTAAVDIDDVYKKVQQVIGTSTMPVFIFSVGYMAKNFKPTPRHTIEQKIIV